MGLGAQRLDVLGLVWLACFLVEGTNRQHVERMITPAADDAKTDMATLVSRLANDLARCFVSAAEDLRSVQPAVAAHGARTKWPDSERPPGCSLR